MLYDKIRPKKKGIIDYFLRIDLDLDHQNVKRGRMEIEKNSHKRRCILACCSQFSRPVDSRSVGLIYWRVER